METEDNKQRIVRFINELNEQGNQVVVEQFLDPAYVDHSAPPYLPPGPEGWRQLRTSFFTAFPDLHVSIEHMVAEGDKVAVEYTIRGTHQGELMGIPPTGKQVMVKGLDINRFKGDKLVERWGNQDDVGMMQQLGVMPA